MRSSRSGGDYTGRHRVSSVEELDMNALRCNIQRRECLLHARHEGRGPAKVDISVSRKADVLEDRSREVAERVEIDADPVVRAGPAITDIAASVREGSHQGE